LYIPAKTWFICFCFIDDLPSLKLWQIIFFDIFG